MALRLSRRVFNSVILKAPLFGRTADKLPDKCHLSTIGLTRNSMFRRRLLLVGGVSFAAVSTVFVIDVVKNSEWMTKRREARETAKPTPLAKLTPVSSVPTIDPSRVVSGPTKIGMKMTLYQYQTCPFCCKLRAFLDYYGIPYDIIEVNPVLRQQIKFSDYRKVPLLIIHKDGEDQVLHLKDSSLIISSLASYLVSRNPKSRHHNESLLNISEWYTNVKVVGDDGKEVDEVINKYFLMFGDVEERKYKKMENLLAEERQWRRWADDVLVHTLSPNIYQTWDEALRSFKYFSEVGEWEKNFSWWERNLVIYVGAAAMYLIGKRLKKRHRLKEDVRQSLYDSCRHWVKFIGPERKFMGGDRPNLADLAVYGVLSSIEGCDAFKDLLEHTNIGSWYYSVKENCKLHVGHNYLAVYKLIG